MRLGLTLTLATILLSLSACSSMYSAAARGALMRGSIEEAEKFMVLGDFSEEEQERLLVTWCQQQNELAKKNDEAAIANLVACFQNGPSAFAEDLELAQLDTDNEPAIDAIAQ